MTEVASQLPGTRFIRIHRSYLIAIDKIEKISRQELFIAGHTLPVGASYEEKITEIRERIKQQK